MNAKRKNEYFSENTYGQATKTILSTVSNVYRQERDWTCSIACLRTIMSGIMPDTEIPTEDYYVNNTGLTMGPQNSRTLKELGYLDGLDYKIAFEEKAPTSNQVGFLLDLMTDYNVMIECMINYAHWIVLLGYIHLGNIEEDRIVYYDPYYNRVNIIVADELISMWHDIGSNPLEQDYIAIKKGLVL